MVKLTKQRHNLQSIAQYKPLTAYALFFYDSHAKTFLSAYGRKNENPKNMAVIPIDVYALG